MSSRQTRTKRLPLKLGVIKPFGTSPKKSPFKCRETSQIKRQQFKRIWIDPLKPFSFMESKKSIDWQLIERFVSLLAKTECFEKSLISEINPDSPEKMLSNIEKHSLWEREVGVSWTHLQQVALKVGAVSGYCRRLFSRYLTAQTTEK